MTKRSFATLVACVFSLVAATVLGQTTASLAGVVRVKGLGDPLPGATVTITSPELQGSRSTITGETGAYSFSALPPGQYKVSITFAGMGSRVINATLRLSQATRADALMDTFAEAITVTGTAPSVIETPEVSTNMTLPFIERLPVLRNQLATAQFAPGVNSNTLS